MRSHLAGSVYNGSMLCDLKMTLLRVCFHEILRGQPCREHLAALALKAEIHFLPRPLPIFTVTGRGS